MQTISTWGNGLLLVFSLFFAYGTYRFVRTVWQTTRRDAPDACK